MTEVFSVMQDEENHKTGRNKKDLSRMLQSDTSSNDSQTQTRIECEDAVGQPDLQTAAGPTTRRAWQDWCKSSSNHGDSQSDSDEGKKERRKPGPVPGAKGGPGRRPRGRVGRRGAPRTKRELKINGLDLLHAQTLLSTSAQTQRLPPAPGCIDQQLTDIVLPLGYPHHEEVRPAVADDGANIPYGLQVLLEVYKNQMMAAVNQFKSTEYRQSIQRQIDAERERQCNLTSKAAQLEKQVKQLIDDSVALLRCRMAELGIEAETPVELLNKAKEIVLRHKDLQAKSASLQDQVNVEELIVSF